MLGFEYYLIAYRAVLLRLVVESSRNFAQPFQVTFALPLHNFSNSVFTRRCTMRRFTVGLTDSMKKNRNTDVNK
jgi:hypothetical protein